MYKTCHRSITIDSKIFNFLHKKTLPIVMRCRRKNRSGEKGRSSSSGRRHK
jgi:hypothetical protein